MNTITSDNKIEADIRTMLQTIYELSQRYSRDWITVRQVAKKQKGSEEFAPMISAYAEMAKEAGFVSISGKGSTRIKLTDAGIQHLLANDTKAPPLSKTEQIARAVEKYAARLKRQQINVQSVVTVAHAGKKFVQAISVNMDDGVILPGTPVEFRPIEGGSPTHGRIVGQDQDRGILYVAFDSEVLQVQLPAKL